MSNIIDMVTSIIEGASDIELSTLTARAVIELNRRAGRRKWELVDEAEHGVVQVEPTKTKTKTTKRKGGGGKSSSPFWVKTVEGFDYNASKQTNFQLTGEWASLHKLDELPTDTWVVIGRKSKSDKQFYFGKTNPKAKADLVGWNDEVVCVSGFVTEVSSASYQDIVDAYRNVGIPQQHVA